MKISREDGFYRLIPENLKKLAAACGHSLYVVGGSVRDFLAGFPVGEDADWDICAPAELFEEEARAAGFCVRAVYRNTGTVKLADPAGAEYEFSRFRSDTYVRGVHRPVSTDFTDDIVRDARRRDFCANAVYFDIGKREFCDPLGGIADIGAGRLRTVAPAAKVFGEDGLRLMRLARIAAQTGLLPDGECLEGARENADLILDIVPERIYAELDGLLFADEKHGDAGAPYRGLCILRDTGVLARVLPELAAGDGMAQRSDFHAHDVLEHSFCCVRYAPPSVRRAALLHDVGKPFCMERDGNFYAHAEEGARIAEDILVRLRAPKAIVKHTAELVRLHMRDFDGRMKENKVRRELVKCCSVLDDLLALKQADYSACRDDLSPAPTVLKWRDILGKMRAEGAPLCLAELAVNGHDLQHAGVPPQRTGEALEKLLFYCAENGARNEHESLIAYAKKHFTEEL